MDPKSSDNNNPENITEKALQFVSSSQGLVAIGGVVVLALMLTGGGDKKPAKSEADSAKQTLVTQETKMTQPESKPQSVEKKVEVATAKPVAVETPQEPKQAEKTPTMKPLEETKISAATETSKAVAPLSASKEPEQKTASTAKVVAPKATESKSMDTQVGQDEPQANSAQAQESQKIEIVKSKHSKVSSFALKNGMQVVVIPDHRAPVVTHMVWYKVGAADEPRGSSGIAHFLEHLMFKGTNNIPSGEFSKIIAKNGGKDNAFTSQDVTTYHQRVAKDRLPLIMKMEADRMVNLVLSEKDVETERDVIIEERRSRVDNNPSSIFQEQLTAALYMNHTYGIPIIGWYDEMSQLSRQDALDFYKQFYAPNNAILIVAGDVTPHEVLRLAEEYYGNIPAVSDISTRKRPSEPPHSAARRLEMEDERVGQRSWQRHFLVPSNVTAKSGDAEALDLLMKVVGSSSTGRLYKKLVVEDKIASSAGGWYSGSGLDYGTLGLYGYPVEGVSLKQVEDAIETVISNVIENGLTQAELDKARKAYTAEYVYANDSQVALARRYGWALIGGQTVDAVDQWPDRLKKVTLEDVQRVAKKFLQEKRSVTGLLRPKKATEKQG